LLAVGRIALRQIVQHIMCNTLRSGDDARETLSRLKAPSLTSLFSPNCEFVIQSSSLDIDEKQGMTSARELASHDVLVV